MSHQPQPQSLLYPILEAARGVLTKEDELLLTWSASGRWPPVGGGGKPEGVAAEFGGGPGGGGGGWYAT